MFVASGMNFIIGCLIIGFWVLSKMLGFCLSCKKSQIIARITFVYQALLGLVFFDFQLICTAEVGLFDYSKLWGTEYKYVVSLGMSYVLLIFMGSELYTAFNLLKGSLLKMKNKKTQKILEGEMSAEDKQKLEKYSEAIDLDKPGNQIYFGLVDAVRFSAIQVILATLQLLNRTQALIILVIDIAFFSYFVVLACQVRIFKKDFMMDKTIIQECCILMILVAVTLFSFTEDSGFSSSLIYSIIETVAVICIIVAVVFEIAMSLVGGYVQFSRAIRRSESSKKSSAQYKKVEKSEERERDSGGSRRGENHLEGLQSSNLTSQRQSPFLFKLERDNNETEGNNRVGFGKVTSDKLGRNSQRRSVNSPLNFRRIRVKNKQLAKGQKKSRFVGFGKD